MPQKSLAVAKYILDRRRNNQDTLSPMQLIKLAYIAHGFMLGWRGEPLLGEQVQAWRYGPVVPSIYHAVKDFGSSPVSDIRGAPGCWQFSPEEISVMDYVADNYSSWNGIQLSDATHQPGTPWSTTWGIFGQNAPISNDMIQNFYAGVINGGTSSAL